MNITPLGDGVYRVSDGTHEGIAWVAGPPSSRWVFFDGRVYVISADTTGTTHSHGLHDDMALAAPMPATVASVRITPGQTVARGDVLIMLEAMKMELPITAPRDGRVTSIACRPGDLVQPGIPLVELE